MLKSFHATNSEMASVILKKIVRCVYSSLLTGKYAPVTMISVTFSLYLHVPSAQVSIVSKTCVKFSVCFKHLLFSFGAIETNEDRTPDEIVLIPTIWSVNYFIKRPTLHLQFLSGIVWTRGEYYFFKITVVLILSAFISNTLLSRILHEELYERIKSE